MNKTLSIILLFLLFLNSSCSDGTTELEEKNLEMVLKTSQLTDSSYFSDIKGIYFNTNKFYMTDYKKNEILLFNTNLEFIKAFGSAGRGPGEFMGAFQIYANKDTIYVQNDGKKTIEIFNNSEHVKSITFPDSIEISDNRFFISKDTLFAPVMNAHNNILRYSPSNQLFGFGSTKKYATERSTAIKNQGHVLKHKNKVIFISDNLAKIKVYNFNGILVSEFNYGEIDMIKKHLSFIERQDAEGLSYRRLVPDAQILSDRLYILVTINDGSQVNSNKILVVDISEESFKPIQILKLNNDGWYTSFSVTPSSIVAFNRSNGFLEKFNYSN